MIIFSLIAAIGFFLSLLAHISTFSNYDLMSEFPAVMGLHVGAMIMCAPMIFSVNKSQGRKKSWKQFLAPMPNWARMTIYAFFAYAIINFIICLLVVGPLGSPKSVEGKYFLQIKGQPEQEVSKAQFDDAQKMVLRMFSGHWMIFFLLPTFFFLFRRPRQVIVQ